MAREIVPIILAFGVGVILYALTVQKEEPRTASTILSLIGATAGLIGITSALTRQPTAGTAIQAVNSMANVGSQAIKAVNIMKL